MNTVLLGFNLRMVRIPEALFRWATKAAANKTRRAIGGLDDPQRRVHHFVVRDLPRLAEPMPPQHIAAALEMDLDRVIEIVDELERRKLFLFRPGGREVEWAYPVTVAETPHWLAFSSGERLNAAWGIDAVATPFVQGKLRNESLSFEIRTECACCGRRIGLSMKHDLSYVLDEPESSPMIFIPIVDLAKLKAPSIIDDFWRKSVFFWSEEHARKHRKAEGGVRGLYLTLDQACWATPVGQEVSFEFGRCPVPSGQSR